MAGKKTAAVLLAGGHGSRMRSKTPKQFLLLAGHTVLWHALKALSESEIDEIVLVTPWGEAETLLREYREEHGFYKIIVISAITDVERRVCGVDGNACLCELHHYAFFKDSIHRLKDNRVMRNYEIHIF